MTEQDRKEFEAFMRDCGCPPHKISTVEGKYIWPLVADHFHTWLAARRTQDAKVRELVEAAKAVIATITTQTPDPHSDVVVDYGKLLRLEDTLAELKEQDDEA